MARGGGQVVSVLDFYSDDSSSNPSESYSFSPKFVFEKICQWPCGNQTKGIPFGPIWSPFFL